MMPSRAGAIPATENRRATLAARAADSSQFDGYSALLIGRLSVKPSTRSGLANRARIAARSRSTALAGPDSCATPLGNRMSVRISISSHCPLLRTTTCLRSINGCSALRTCTSMRPRFAGGVAWCATSRPSPPCIATGCGGIGTAIGTTEAPACPAGAAIEGLMLCGRTRVGGSGAIAWLEPLNASISDSDITRNLPSLTTETAYITTKNASSRVIRSA